MNKQIKCIFGLLLIFAVMVMPAFAADNDTRLNVYDKDGNPVPHAAQKSDDDHDENDQEKTVSEDKEDEEDDEYEDINDFFESASNEESSEAVDELFPSMGQGVGAVKQVKPIWNPAKFTTWFVIGLAVIVGVLTFAGHYLKTNAGSLFDKAKWVLGGQKGMFISGLLLLIFIVYLSVIKFIAHF